MASNRHFPTRPTESSNRLRTHCKDTSTTHRSMPRIDVSRRRMTEWPPAQRERRNAITASRSAGSIDSNAAREADASPPCDWIASRRLDARPSCMNSRGRPLFSRRSMLRPRPHRGGVRIGCPVTWWSFMSVYGRSTMSLNIAGASGDVFCVGVWHAAQPASMNAIDPLRTRGSSCAA